MVVGFKFFSKAKRAHAFIVFSFINIQSLAGEIHY